jgi:general L-amino acid transport system permease protein
MSLENMTSRASPAIISPRWDARSLRRAIYQLVALGAVIVFFGLLLRNIWTNLKAAGIGVNFDFLSQPASFDVPDSLMRFAPGNSIGKAFLVGTVNTLEVSALGVLLSSVFGLIVGLCRLSTARVVLNAGKFYVEIVRNTPLLLQLLFWHTLFTHAFPLPVAAIQPLPCVFLTNRGIFVPELSGASAAMVLAAAGAVVGLIWSWHGRSSRILAVASMALFLSAAAVWFAFGSTEAAVTACPQLQRFNIKGGWQQTPEFAALLVSLSLYTAAFIAEILRGAILSIPHGQSEAARALGLKHGFVLRLVVIPQAVRAMVPPLTSQYLNLLKGSSLAVAVAYPDVVRVATITISQTGRAIECMFIVMAIYLLISVSVSFGMNLYNRRQLSKGL